jgi:hypothetical protein
MNQDFVCPTCSAPVPGNAIRCGACGQVFAASQEIPPRGGKGCGYFLLVLLLLFGGLGLLVGGLMLAGMGAVGGRIDGLLVGLGLGAAVVGVVLMVVSRRAGRVCPGCGRWGVKDDLPPEDHWPKKDEEGNNQRYYNCSGCGHRWRE